MDDYLARRLAALRNEYETRSFSSSLTPATTIPQTSSSPPKTPKTEVNDELTARFEKMRLTPSSAKSSSVKELKKEYEDILSESKTQEIFNALSSNQEFWDTGEDSHEEMDEVDLLLAEAKAYIPSPPKAPKDVNGAKNALPEDLSVPPDWLHSDTLRPVATTEEEEEADILQRIRDEIDFERANGITTPPEPPSPPGPAEPGEAAPEVDESLFKRFEALGGLELPTVPKAEPGVKPKPHLMAAKPGDDETDTWCCICNDDAEYKCSGCENDIYCASCLYESHTGPDAGYEERRHKWTKYTKPKKRLAAA
ncbi:unnamed protein product [Tuber melanosporum]|uniref:(Perigord truffle) hypothetical protein n=1 Tax=Tuber melanosporum (strain Mel28) TaxID=656061 RepID=D5GIX9_TUBMM|nr:uncharacterized protein GSTUM_00008732001 [Tuber melanosporum]CAZ84472.1 unnamed protein product [Tuber melanosporum]